MFKSWRGERKKIKTVFKLQFQATQVPQLKKPALIISLVPEDVGKTTFKLEKTAVQEGGTCSWENPIFVTVKLVKEPKSGKLHEKIYHFIVSTGSSKSGYLGEASIDFADFAEENEPLTVSLPLKFANSGAVLHVTIERVQGDAEQRRLEDHGDFSLRQDGSLKNQLNGGHPDGNNKSFAKDQNRDLTLKDVNRDSSFKSSIDSFASCQSSPRRDSMPKGTVDDITSKNSLHRRSSTDWSVGSVSDGSLIDSTNSPEDNLPQELQEACDGSEKLKNEISCLLRQAELSEIELQSLRKQVTKESRRGQDLSRQVIELKEEREALRIECELQKTSVKHFDREGALNQLQAETEEYMILLEEIRRELSHEKEMNTNLKLQLQKTQDSNSELILAVGDLDEMLEQKNKEISCLSTELELNKNTIDAQATKCECKVKEDQALLRHEELTREQSDASELCLLKQKITDLSYEIEVSREKITDLSYEIEVSREKTTDLCNEIEFSKENRVNLEKYVETVTQDYEDLKQKNHDISSSLEQTVQDAVKTHGDLLESLADINELESQIQRLEEKLKKQTQEYSEALVSINELKDQVKGLEMEMEKQAQGFENDLESMTLSKIEQEQRAIRAEEALRKTRWKNAVTAERLHEEFRRLSVEMAGRFDEKENLTTKALTEANELRVHNRELEENLQKANEELLLIKEQDREKAELLTQLNLKTKHAEQILLGLEDNSKQLIYAKQREQEGKHEEVSIEVKLQQTTKSFEETKMLLERLEKEKDEMKETLAVAKKDGEKTLEELYVLRSLKDEKEKVIGNVLSQVQELSVELIELKNRFSKEELENKNLQKQVHQLKTELQKKEEESTIAVRKNKNNKVVGLLSSKESQAGANARESMLHSEMSTTGSRAIDREVKVTPCGRDGNSSTELLTEMKLLKERNKAMETELKEMQERYSQISLKFAEVEGERQQLVMTVRNLKNGKKN